MIIGVRDIEGLRILVLNYHHFLLCSSTDGRWYARSQGLSA
jgi:hypothetical protein